MILRASIFAALAPVPLPPPLLDLPRCMFLTWRLRQVCLKGMIQKKYGKIVNITSQSAVIATKAHAACKHDPATRAAAAAAESSRVAAPTAIIAVTR